jgi:hypothetical protein
MSIRRLVVDFEEEGVAPTIVLEGNWSRKLIDMLNIQLMKALRRYKMEQAKRLATINEIEEKKDVRRKR